MPSKRKRGFSYVSGSQSTAAIDHLVIDEFNEAGFVENNNEGYNGDEDMQHSALLFHDEDTDENVLFNCSLILEAYERDRTFLISCEEAIAKYPDVPFKYSRVSHLESRYCEAQERNEYDQCNANIMASKT